MDDVQPSTSGLDTICPLCFKKFLMTEIEVHASMCLLESNTINDLTIATTSRPSSAALPVPAEQTIKPKGHFSIFDRSPAGKRTRTTEPTSADVKSIDVSSSDENEEDEAALKRTKSSEPQNNAKQSTRPITDSNVPLAERVRPTKIEDYVGQEQIIGKNTILRTLFDGGSIPSMILWGPPGCGKTTLANIISKHCQQNGAAMRFVKLSATMAGVNELKTEVKVAKNELKYKRRTILFMDEIHRFNKLQQDIFLPHVESGTITLIGATTENPSYSLNSALLSRCRVIVLEKHTAEGMQRILERALPEYSAIMVPDGNNNMLNPPDFSKLPFIPRLMIRDDTIRWLAETCDGDARIGLNGLQMALQAASATLADEISSLKVISLEDVREGIKKSHLLYDRKGDQHYDLISALHKSIRASDDNAALYWVTRMIMSGEDPRYICRRMVRMASEDIGVANTSALQVATATLTAVQSVGMPEADCIIAHCAVYLARSPKSREVYDAYQQCRASIEAWKGPMPGVPLHLRNGPTHGMHDPEPDTGCMPKELRDENYFSD